MATDYVETAMAEAFDLLRWSVFEDVPNILVTDNAEQPSPNLSSFVGHPIATEAATETPLHEITFTIETLDDYEAYGYVRPRPLIVRRADGGIVTVADVVEQLSAHLIAHKDEILEAKEPLLHARSRGADGELRMSVPALPVEENIPTNTRVFFDGFFGDIESGTRALPIQLWAEGECGESVEEHFN
jgi:hypothetical protein